MPAAITPYSIAVTPLRSTFTRSKRENVYANADPSVTGMPAQPVAFLYLFVATTSLQYIWLEIVQNQSTKGLTSRECANSIAPLETSVPLRG
jgi:hypothetical protein